MPFLDHLHHLSPACQNAFYDRGREQAYSDGEPLPGPEAGFRGIRLIQDGEVRVLACVGDQRIPVYHYGAGEALGIRSFMRPENPPELAWVAVGDCVVFEVGANELRDLMRDAACSELHELLELEAHLRDLEIQLAIHPLFRTLHENERHRLFDDADPIALAPEQLLIEKGRANEALYFISHGGLDIIRDGRTVAHRGAGEIIGEVSALGFAPTADVRSTGWTSVLAFPRDALLEACQHNREFAARLSSYGLTGFEQPAC